jgi:putative ubiquitin-RnfH superfamily antitoxin RatB of RatAB toxin-antitoxin module
MNITIAVDTGDTFCEEIPYTVETSCTIGDALHQYDASIDLSKGEVGIFGKPASLDTALNEGDRIELYQPLRIDPMEARRRRAEKRRFKG